MNKRPSMWGLPLLLVAGVLAGCGSGSDDPSASDESGGAEGAQVAAVDPCSLVTAEEVAAVIGEKVLGTEASGDSCTYQTEDADASAVTVLVKPQGAAEEMEAITAANQVLGNIGEQMEGEEGAVGDVGDALASGKGSASLGDQSVFDGNAQLHIRKGEAYLAVAPPMMRSRMSGGNPLLSAAERRAMATAIAEKALAKL